MSKLIDKLNQVSKAISQPMGFRVGQPVLPQPKLLLVASLAQVNVDNLADNIAGADAGLLAISNLSSGAETLQRICQVVSNIPWGVWLRDIDREEIKQIAKVNCDFLVFPVDTSLAILEDSQTGKILQVEASLSEGLLKAVNELPVDAVLIGQEGEYFLTWYHLMLFQHFADLLIKPLLVCIPSNVTANELQALGEAGVRGVVVEVGQPVGGLNELRQAIDKFQPQRRKPRALLPYISSEGGMDY